MKINENEIADYIKEYYQEKHSDLIVTKRICNGIVPIIMEGLKKAPQEVSEKVITQSIDLFLEKDNVLEFARKRQPNLQAIPKEEVIKLNRYFQEYLPQYKITHIYRRSNSMEESNLYCATARDEDGTYGCWSLWNASSLSLNTGHYNLNSEEEGICILNGLYHDVTDEPDKYGLLTTECEPYQDIELQEEKQVSDKIIEYQRRGRHV